MPLPAPRRAAGPVEDTPTPAVDDAPKLFKVWDDNFISSFCLPPRRFCLQFDSSGWSHLGVFDNDDLESDGMFLMPLVHSLSNSSRRPLP